MGYYVDRRKKRRGGISQLSFCLDPIVAIPLHSLWGENSPDSFAQNFCSYELLGNFFMEWIAFVNEAC